MLRGGSWNNNSSNLRASNRNDNEPENRNNNIGFRLSRDVERSREGGFAAGAAGTKVAAGVRFHFRIAFPTTAEGRRASNMKAAPVLW